MEPMSQPIYHLLPYSAWQEASEESAYAPKNLSTEGFVHFSGDEATLLAVANAYYHDVTEPMAVLTVDPDRLTAKVRWEPPTQASEDQLFPHVYGAIDKAAVISVRHAQRDSDGRYTDLIRPPATASALDLGPHPEGGWYRQTWASPVRFTPPGRGERASATAILFLLCPGEESRWHRVASDELWLWHSGAALELQLGGSHATPYPERTITLGPDRSADQRVQALVPANTWQAARPKTDEEVLVSCVVAPGFDFADIEMTP